MEKLAKNYSYNLLYQLFLIIVPLVTAPYLARVLGPTELGKYGYINSVTTIISTVGLLGLNNYGIREIAYFQDNSIKQNDVLVEITSARLLLLLINSVLYITFALKSEYPRLFLIQYILMIALFIDSSWYIIGTEKLELVTFKNFISKLLTVILIFILVKNKNDLPIYLGVIAITSFITIIILNQYVIRNTNWYKPKFNNIVRHFLPSLKLFLPQIASTLYLQVDKLMLNWLGNNASEIAYYDQGSKFIQIPLSLITSLSLVMMPRMASEFNKQNKIGLSKYVEGSLLVSLLLSIPMTIGLITIIPNIIPWYLGSNFTPVIKVTQILSPLIVLNSLLNISGNQYFTATNQVKYLSISYLVSLTINIVLNIFLIPAFSSTGAAISAVISAVFNVIIQYIYVSKQINLLSQFKVGIKYVLISGLMGSTLSLVGFYFEPSILLTLIQLTLGILFYILILLISKDKLTLKIINVIVSFLPKS